MEPRLVLLSRGPELYSTRRLATEAEREGWMVDIIDPLALTIVVDDDGGRVFHKGWPVAVSYTHLTLPTNREV